MSVQFPRASFIRRLGSWLYDALLSIAVWMFAGAISFSIFGVLFDQGIIENQGFKHAIELQQSSIIYSICIYGWNFAWVSYFFVYFWARSGQTLGMRAWRLRVQNQSGGLISKKTGLKRILPTLLGLGNLWVLFSPSKLSLQDKVTHTEVVLLSLEANKGANWSNG